ncbi:MAG: potassium/proton antiporter [Bacteroidetes bacterium]|nr:potassium/proton antiporter [Bacteroidota bacterium]
MIPIEYLLLVGSVLVLLSVMIAKVSDRLGLPMLLLFIAVGMVAGSEGIGGIAFDDPRLAQSVGIVALIFILFAGGFDTKWSNVSGVFWQAAGLSTIGVFLTAFFVAVFAARLLGLSMLDGFLLGAIVSSTDAAAVFAVLRSRDISLKGNLASLLELESGSNDPMAVFLTMGTIELMKVHDASIFNIAIQFVLQIGIGLLAGLVIGRIMVAALNKLKIWFEGIYPVMVLAFVAFAYGATAIIGGSGFLAVYVAGLAAGNHEFVQKKSLLRFFDGFAWLSQIGMFLTLGLLVFPSEIFPVAGAGFLISAFLMFAARPVSVFLTMSLSRSRWRERVFVSWVGLRGAVPIILATFPLIAGLPGAKMLFNLVFFIVLTSALLQGWSVPYAAKLLKVDSPIKRRKRHPLEFAPSEGTNADLIDFIVPFGSAVTGKSIVELGLPQDTLVVLIGRDEEYMVPSGGTVVQEGDTLLVLASAGSLPEVRERLSELKHRH